MRAGRFIWDHLAFGCFLLLPASCCFLMPVLLLMFSGDRRMPPKPATESQWSEFDPKISASFLTTAESLERYLLDIFVFFAYFRHFLIISQCQDEISTKKVFVPNVMSIWDPRFEASGGTVLRTEDESSRPDEASEEADDSTTDFVMLQTWKQLQCCSELF